MPTARSWFHRVVEEHWHIGLNDLLAVTGTSKERFSLTMTSKIPLFLVTIIFVVLTTAGIGVKVHTSRDLFRGGGPVTVGTINPQRTLDLPVDASLVNV